MEETEGPFDHFWGPINVNDFEIKPFFDSNLIDNDVIRDINCSLVNVFDHDHQQQLQQNTMKCESLDQEEEEEKQLKCNVTAERRAERFCSKLPSYPSISCSSPVVELPYLTIPPGLSPAALLESPTMLPNSQQSPTTGTFPLAPCDDDTSMMNSLSPARTDLFKPPGDFPHMPCTTSSARDRSLMSSKVLAETSNDTRVTMQSSPAEIVRQKAPLLRECVKVETKIPPFFEPEQKRILPHMKTSCAGDGYCWRKYGQKHVKGSEYPRSYYKCNNSNCPVKKKVERSHDGEITEIIYNGAHNHPKPNLRLSLACQANTSNDMLDSCEVSEPSKMESWTGWRCNQLMNPSVGSDWIADGMEGTSSGPVLNEFCDPSSSNQEKSAVLYGSSMQTPENATTIVRQNGDDQDGNTSPSEDESELKKRKREMFTSEAYLPSRSTREPRIILQIESEIDVLEDGYRWRKYGQKVVKGNPNPRSYYKCTSVGCPVRKHVERASEDIKSVITTYEGKHNHEVPTTKTGGAPTVGHSPQNVSDATNHVFALPRNPIASNAQMKVQDFPNHYPMKPALGNEFPRSPFLGDFVNDMTIGAPSIYSMKFPALQTPMLYNNPFINGGEFQTPSFGTPLMHDLPMINASRTTNMNASGIHPSDHPRPCGVVQSSVGIQPIKENELRFFKPKEEQKGDNSFDTCLEATPNNERPSTPFCRAVGNFPTRNTF